MEAKSLRIFSRPFRAALVLGLVLLITITGCDDSKPTSPAETTEKPPSPALKLNEADKVVLQIVESEELILELTKRLSKLTKAMENQSLSGLDFVNPTLNYVGIASPLSKTIQSSSGFRDVSIIDIPVTPKPAACPRDQVWKNVLTEFEASDSRFGVLEGEFKTANRFHMKTKVEGILKASSNDGVPRGFQAEQTLVWERKESRWMITEWTQTAFRLISANRNMFRDVTREVIPDQEVQTRLTQSTHEEQLIAHLKRGTIVFDQEFTQLTGHEDWESAYLFPSASVVDFDQDGWDDLFVLDRWGPSTLLRNQGDGTFQDVTIESGLVVPHFASCALFADFDNDGDPDAFVCRTMGPSIYFVNDGGKFTETMRINGSKLVVSASAVDINNDGWLDIYVCTYNGGATKMNFDPRRATPQQMARLQKMSSFIDRIGPPNQVIINRKGNFELGKVDRTTKQFRNTYQSAWSDFDHDGDMDLYICNDFAPDAFMRNDTPKGSFDLRFTDVSEEVFPDGIMGFGMGASWGDFDANGKMDLYVSNMYSKAGKRIIKMTGKVDPRIEVSSRGNFLFSNQGDSFIQLAGTDQDDQHVGKVGWSFGGQFADFNNDAQLDLYVPSGFFTPPDDVKTDEDL